MDPLEALVMSIEWVPVLVGTVLAFLLGWLWYSPRLFLKPWLAGLPEPVKWQAPMWMPMSAQFGSTLFLAIIVNLLLAAGQNLVLALVVLMLMGFIKASGMYCGKTKVAISVEVLFIFIMALLLVAVNVVI